MMKYLRLPLAAYILTSTLAISTFAGEMSTPRTVATTGEMDTGIASVSDPIIEIALGLFQDLLSLF